MGTGYKQGTASKNIRRCKGEGEGVGLGGPEGHFHSAGQRVAGLRLSASTVVHRHWSGAHTCRHGVCAAATTVPAIPVRALARRATCWRTTRLRTSCGAWTATTTAPWTCRSSSPRSWTGTRCSRNRTGRCAAQEGGSLGGRGGEGRGGEGSGGEGRGGEGRVVVVGKG